MKHFLITVIGLGVLFLSCSRTEDLSSLDNQAPEVLITYPANYQLLTQHTVTIKANATDNLGINRVYFYLNGDNIGSVAQPPYQFTAVVDSSLAQATLLAEAEDKNGNRRLSQIITVYFQNSDDNNAPVVSILSPATWTEFTGDTLEVKLHAFDNQGIERIVCYFNGDSVWVIHSQPYLWKQPVANYSGNTTLMVKALDFAGNYSYSSPVTVSLNLPDVTPPEVQIIQPADWQTVSGTFTVRLAATDNRAIEKIEVFWAGSIIDTLTGEPYETSLNSALYSNGNYTIMARAYDPAGREIPG